MSMNCCSTKLSEDKKAETVFKKNFVGKTSK